MQAEQYKKYIEDTLERKDLEGLFGIWSASRNQGQFGKKVRQLIKEAIPTLARFHHLTLEKNTFQELMEKYDDERVLQITIKDKKYLQHFMEDDDLAGLKRVLPFESAKKIAKAVKKLKVAPTLRVLKTLIPLYLEKLSDDAMRTLNISRVFVKLTNLMVKESNLEGIDYLCTFLEIHKYLVLSTALAAAAKANNRKLIEELLARGVDSDYLLQGAVESNNWDLLDYYKEKYPFEKDDEEGALFTGLLYALCNEQQKPRNDDLLS